MAKNLVAAGVADRVEIQLSYAIGVARPISISVETFGTSHLDDGAILSLIDRHFDLRPMAIMRDLRLQRPIYASSAKYGHFGRSDVMFPWEETARAEAIAKDAGLARASDRAPESAASEAGA